MLRYITTGTRSQKERENFYRNSTVIVDIGKKVLSALLNYDLANQNITLPDFINKHQHEIYHMCFNRTLCCLCKHGKLPPSVPAARIVRQDQLDVLFEKHPGHSTNIGSQYCCLSAKSTITTSGLDITLLRFLLINFSANWTTGQPVRKAVEDLVRYRDVLYAHAEEAKILDTEYLKYQPHIEKCILHIADSCNIKEEVQQNLKDAYKRPLDEMVCLEFKNLLLNDIRRQSEIEQDIRCIELHATEIHNQIQSLIKNSTNSQLDNIGACSSNLENKLKDLQKFCMDQDKNATEKIDENKTEIVNAIQTVQERVNDCKVAIHDVKSSMQMQCKEITDYLKETIQHSIGTMNHVKGF